jgi:hypothetical protein
MSNIPKTKKRSWNGELSAMSKMWNLLEPMSHLQRRTHPGVVDRARKPNTGTSWNLTT